MCAMEQTITITHIDNPYRFWFEYGGRKDEYTELMIGEVYKYADKMHKAGNWLNANEAIVGDYVAAFVHDNTGQKWVRGYIRATEDASNGGFRFWSIDNGCEFRVEANCLVSLKDSEFATPITTRLYVGGLCDSRPAGMVCFNAQFLLLFFLYVCVKSVR